MQTRFSGNVFVYTGHIKNADEQKTEKKRVSEPIQQFIKADIKPVTDDISAFYFLEKDDFYVDGVSKSYQDRIAKETKAKETFTRLLASRLIPFVVINGPELEWFRSEAFAKGLESSFEQYGDSINTLSREIVRNGSPLLRAIMEQEVSGRSTLSRGDTGKQELQLLKRVQNGMTDSAEAMASLLEQLKSHPESGFYAEKLQEKDGNLFLKA